MYILPLTLLPKQTQKNRKFFFFFKRHKVPKKDNEKRDDSTKILEAGKKVSHLVNQRNLNPKARKEKKENQHDLYN